MAGDAHRRSAAHRYRVPGDLTLHRGRLERTRPHLHTADRRIRRMEPSRHRQRQHFQPTNRHCMPRRAALHRRGSKRKHNRWPRTLEPTDQSHTHAAAQETRTKREYAARRPAARRYLGRPADRWRAHGRFVRHPALTEPRRKGSTDRGRSSNPQHRAKGPRRSRGGSRGQAIPRTGTTTHAGRTRNLHSHRQRTHLPHDHTRAALTPATPTPPKKASSRVESA